MNDDRARARVALRLLCGVSAVVELCFQNETHNTHLKPILLGGSYWLRLSRSLTLSISCCLSRARETSVRALWCSCCEVLKKRLALPTVPGPAVLTVCRRSYAPLSLSLTSAPTHTNVRGAQCVRVDSYSPSHDRTRECV